MAFKKLFSRKAKPASPVPSNNTDNISGCFDCNICLDSVRDPVVTLCGHLYCWPCIYEWFNVQSTTLALDEHPLCPVCKAEISQTTVVPLYGRGQTPSHPGNRHGIEPPSVPPRPPAYGSRELLSANTPRPSHQVPFQNPYPGGGSQYYPQPSQQLPPANAVHPVLEMLVEMIYARAFGNSSRNLYSIENAYRHAVNPRLRRREMQTHKSLNRMSLFFLCCIILCLFLF